MTSVPKSSQASDQKAKKDITPQKWRNARWWQGSDALAVGKRILHRMRVRGDSFS